MPMGMIFWLLWLLWFVLGLCWHWPRQDRFALGTHVLMFILFFLLGWKVFGFVVQ